ncbi:MAG TPA: hypothetical protein VFL84_12115 [Gammaproteobacteria bacterium]|nr:hypothetical protein [Gammaproteobacteria bacterium]
MTAIADNAARQAIVTYLLEALKGRSAKELRIAFLTRDAVAEVVSAVIRDFVAELAAIFRDRDPAMEPLAGELGPDTFAGIQWRHPTWRRGTAIRLEFQRSNRAAPIAGLCAPSERALVGAVGGQHEALDQPTRDKISAALANARGVTLLGRDSAWWPAYQYLEPPLDDWNTAHALMRVAGIELHEGRMCRDWLADEFVAIRQAVRPIIG